MSAQSAPAEYMSHGTRQRGHSRKSRPAILFLPRGSPNFVSKRYAIALVVECGIDVSFAGVGKAMVSP